MERACFAPVKAAVGGAMTDDQIKTLIDDVMASIDYERIEAGVSARSERQPLSEAQIRAIIAKQTRRQMLEYFTQRRMKAASEKARAARDAAIAAMPDEVHGQAFTIADKLRAYNTGSDKTGHSLGFSVEAESKARLYEILTPLDKALDDSDGRELLSGAFNKAAREAHEGDVAIEMARDNGADLPETGNALAVKHAKAFNRALETARLLQNNAGAWIAKRTGYIARQMHDPLKLAGGFWNMGPDGKAKAFEGWHEFIRPLLSDETWADLDATEFDADRLARFDGDAKKAYLELVWENIVEGKRIGKVGSDFENDYVPPGSKARSVSRDRSLHFTDPSAWMTYHQRFGQGSLYGVIMNQIEGAARNAAVMNRWGPNPEAAFAAFKTKAIADLRNGQGARSIETVQRLDGREIQNEWDILTGAAGAPKDLRIAAVGNVIRLDQRLSKLGGAVLASLGPDQAIAAQVFKRHGARFLDGYSGAFSGVFRLNRAAQKEAAQLLGVGAKASITEISQRFDANDGVQGIGASLTNTLFKVTGFQAVMNGHRRGVAAMWSNWMAGLSDQDFSALPEATQAQFSKYGMGPKHWDQIRRGVTQLSDGRRYLTFDGLDGDTGVRARAYLAQFIDDTLTEPGIRDQAKLTQGLQAGTYVGEAFRCFTQFKAFPLTYMTRHLNPAVGAIKAGDAGAGGAMAHLIISGVIMGFMAMQAKQLAKGLTPRPIYDDEGNPRLDVWVAALLQGGGLGLYGDFLFGEYSRAGGVIETLAGPAVGEFGNVAKLLNRLANFKDYDEETLGDAGGDAFRVIKNNVPFMNVWWAKGALDSLILHRIQEAVSPGYLDRYKERIRKEQGQEFMFEPQN